MPGSGPTRSPASRDRWPCSEEVTTWNYCLLELMKMEHLVAQLDVVCGQAPNGDLDYKSVFSPRPWRPSGTAGSSQDVESGSSWPGCCGVTYLVLDTKNPSLKSCVQGGVGPADNRRGEGSRRGDGPGDLAEV